MSVFDQVEAAATLDTVVIYSSKQPGALTLTTNQSSCTASQAVSVKVSVITFLHFFLHSKFSFKKDTIKTWLICDRCGDKKDWNLASQDQGGAEHVQGRLLDSHEGGPQPGCGRSGFRA